MIDARSIGEKRLAKLLGLGQKVVLYEVGLGLYGLLLGTRQMEAIVAKYDLDFTTSDPQVEQTDPLMLELQREIETCLRPEQRPPILRTSATLGPRRPEDLEYGLASYFLARCAAMTAWTCQEEKARACAWKWVAELILRGNLLIGAYEQTRVQQVLEYPVEDFAGDFVRERAGFEAAQRSGTGRWRRRLDRRVQRELTGRVPELWGRFLTDQLLVLKLGDELIRLGRDIPPPPGSSSFFPAELTTIEDRWLQLLLRRYDHSYGSGHGTQSRIWSQFDDRMNFIVNLMRSRAQTPGLWKSPFPGKQTIKIRQGNDPGTER
jgi:hypothetical protein